MCTETLPDTTMICADTTVCPVCPEFGVCGSKAPIAPTALSVSPVSLSFDSVKFNHQAYESTYEVPRVVLVVFVVVVELIIVVVVVVVVVVTTGAVEVEVGPTVTTCGCGCGCGNGVLVVLVVVEVL